MQKLTIKRSEWLRGEGGTESYLLRKADNKKCCLGFLALSCGFNEAQILDISSPEDTENKLLWPKSILREELDKDSDITFTLVKLNDNENLLESERELRLKEEFANIDIDVEFVD